MLFDKNFDKSLWLLIKGDRRNRGKIVDFVKSLSNEFIVMIQEGLLEYEKYKKDFEDWKKAAQSKVKAYKQGKITKDELFEWIMKNK